MSVTRFSETSDLYIYEATEGWYVYGPGHENCGPHDPEQAVYWVKKLVADGAAIDMPLEDIIEAITEEGE